VNSASLTTTFNPDASWDPGWLGRSRVPFL
jgi:hypothetical protein